MKYKLSQDEDLMSFEGWAFLLFHTRWPAFAFADQLNRLYDFVLARRDDMECMDGVWPLYSYYDTSNRLHYYLVERPAAAVSPWEAGDKLLIVKGENADSAARFIYSDFTATSAIAEGDLLARQHAECLEALLADFTLPQLLDFNDMGLSRKALKELAPVQQACDTILTYIDTRLLDVTDRGTMFSMRQ